MIWTNVGLYFIDAAFGGYDPYFTSDERSQYTSGLLMHDCIMWQPRFGSYYNEYRHDFYRADILSAALA